MEEKAHKNESAAKAVMRPQTLACMTPNLCSFHNVLPQRRAGVCMWEELGEGQPCSTWGVLGNRLGWGTGRLKRIAWCVCYRGGQIPEFQGSFHLAKFYRTDFLTP